MGTPKSSICRWIFPIFTIQLWGTPIYGNPHMFSPGSGSMTRSDLFATPSFFHFEGSEGPGGSLAPLAQLAPGFCS